MKLAAVLAAGESRRFGADKLCADLGGAPVLARSLAAASASGADALICLLPSLEGERARIATGAGATPVLVADAARGLSASVRAVARAAETQDAAFLLLALGDAPLIPPEHHRALFKEAALNPSGLAFTTCEDLRTPPAVFAARHFAALVEAGGDKGARDLLAAAPEASGLPLEAELLIDVDTPVDLERAAAVLAGPKTG